MASGVFLSTRLAFQSNTRYTLAKSYKTAVNEELRPTYFLVYKADPSAHHQN